MSKTGTRIDIPMVDAFGHSDNKYPLLSLLETICGCSVILNVDKNPFHDNLEDLTENAWYLVYPDQIKESKVGFWKPKGEAHEIFSDLPITCWEITHEFHEMRNRKTDWMMLEYKIITPKEMFSLCRVWQDTPAHAEVGSGVPFGPMADYAVQATRNLADMDLFLEGDYLELLDLDVPLSPSSSSENPSCLTDVGTFCN